MRECIRGHLAQGVGKDRETMLLTSRTTLELVTFGSFATMACYTIALQHGSKALRCLYLPVLVDVWVLSAEDETDRG